MRPGEILAHFPFGDVPGMKLRPVLLLTDAVHCSRGFGRLYFFRYSCSAASFRRSAGPFQSGIPFDASQDPLCFALT